MEKNGGWWVGGEDWVLPGGSGGQQGSVCRPEDEVTGGVTGVSRVTTW